MRLYGEQNILVAADFMNFIKTLRFSLSHTSVSVALNLHYNDKTTLSVRLPSKDLFIFAPPNNFKTYKFDLYAVGHIVPLY